VHALCNVSLDIQAGELVVMLGPSGSGKSTLLNIMGGLGRPTSGQLFFRSTELTALGERGLTSSDVSTSAFFSNSTISYRA